jgi:hypothetical protein
MDPDANLREQREIVERMQTAFDAADPDTGRWVPDPDDAHRLAELSAAMDTWLCRGGTLPADWPCARSAEQEAER